MIFINAANSGATGALRLMDVNAWITGSTDLRDGQWHHVAVVLENDGSADISEAAVYGGDR